MSRPPFALADKVPNDREECDACHFSTRHLHKVPRPFFAREQPDQWFCDLCWSSFAGNAAQYPDQYPEKKVLHHLCYLTNVLLEAIGDRT